MKGTIDLTTQVGEFLTLREPLWIASCHLTSTSNAVIGISVLAAADEDYQELRSKCASADFCELNLKYSFRVAPAGNQALLAALPDRYRAVLLEIDRFTRAFGDHPIFVKLPRELDWLPNTSEQQELLRILEGHGKAGLVIANSLKQNLAPLMVDGRELVLCGGVLCGEFLFDSTLQLLGTFAEACQDRHIPLVASGGLIREDQILLSLRAGAAAVQLCSTTSTCRIPASRR